VKMIEIGLKSSSRSIFSVLSFAICLLGFTSCSSTHVKRLSNETYAPKAFYDVKVYDSFDDVIEEYTKLGVLVKSMTQPANRLTSGGEDGKGSMSLDEARSVAKRYLCKKAGKMGADAVVLLEYRGYMVDYVPTANPIRSRRVTVMAIKLK